MHLAPLSTLAPISAVPSFSAQIIEPGSPEFQEASSLLVRGFARARQPGSHISYLETLSAEQLIPLVLRRRATQGDSPIIGAVLLEVASGECEDEFVRFRPGSFAAHVSARGACAEIRGLVVDGLSPQETQDALDTLGLMMVRAAQHVGLEWLWTQPRLPIMASLLAEIPGLLPPYRFTLCRDVLGWHESKSLRKLRELRLKEMPIAEDEMPVIYALPPEVLAEDLRQRLDLLEKRQQHPQFASLLAAATRQALRAIHQQHAQLQVGKSRKEGAHVSLAGMPLISSSGTEAGGHPTEQVASPPSGPASSAAPLASPRFSPEFLRQIVELGGEEIARYKSLSYQLLQLGPAMHVLDVGCGPGVDLLPLAKKVGKQGQVTGLDIDSELLREAQQVFLKHKQIRLVEGRAEELPFVDETFDRVRADRVLQHLPKPKQVVSELWRVLRPGGWVVLVEPDWKTVAIYPGSSAGGDDDRTLSEVLAYNQRQSVHPLMGRQLRSLFWEDGISFWHDLQVQSLALSHTSWPVADALLTLTQLALDLAKEAPAVASEITAWLRAIERAADYGEFMASIQLFFASARKPDRGNLPSK